MITTDQIAVAREVGAHVAYLPGLAMRRIADLHPGNAETDARGAYVIAEAARTTPHAPRTPVRRPWPTPSAAPTTTATEPKARSTTPP